MLKTKLEELVEQQAARIAELEALPHHDITTVQDANTVIAVYGYLVFGWQDYSASGGWNDYRQCFATQEAAQECAEAYLAEMDGSMYRAQVVELPTGRVQEFGREE
jgi:hypothetical protein